MPAARALALVVYALATGSLITTALSEPEWNFDAVGYVGASLNGSPLEVQQQAYQAIASAAPAAQAQAIAALSAYRRHLAADADAFAALLPVYRFKWGYVALVKVMASLGANPATATHVISTAAYAVLALALLGWLWKQKASPRVLLLAALLVTAPPLAELARLSTPDMLVVSLMALGAAALSANDRRWSGLGLIALCLCGLARPDAALHTVVVLAALALSDRTERRRAALGIGAVGLLAGGAALASGPAEVAAVVGKYFTAGVYAGATDQSGLSSYVNALVVGLRGSILYHPSVIGLWAVLGLVALTGLRGAPHQRTRVVLVAAWVAIPLRFLLFPDRSDRFFAGTYAITGFALLVAALSVPPRSAEATPLNKQAEQQLGANSLSTPERQPSGEWLAPHPDPLPAPQGEEHRSEQVSVDHAHHHRRGSSRPRARALSLRSSTLQTLIIERLPPH